jgi:hypothetical protein
VHVSQRKPLLQPNTAVRETCVHVIMHAERHRASASEQRQNLKMSNVEYQAISPGFRREMLRPAMAESLNTETTDKGRRDRR